MTSGEWRRVGEAIVVWSGWGRASHPARDEQLLARHFGRELAAALAPLVRAFAEEFDASDARHLAVDLPEMGRIASAQFMKKHPALPADAARALAWCYTFDNR